ncbi:MAG: methyltransferase domain-containing protein [Acidimicrobiales bacterium]|nr:methyltransferase domain-containing protein [Acidimicrobiales bacterium]
MANEAMKEAWDGSEGDHWAEHADWYDNASAQMIAAYVAAIGAAPSDNVLDIGCGAGGLSLDLAPQCAAVHGVDLSSKMLDVARKRAADGGITNATFEQLDAQTDALGSGYDLVVSSFGVMFFDDPTAAFTNIGGALKPGGRLALAAWRGLPENEWLMEIRGALALGRELGFPPLEAPTPFSLSNVERTTSILESAGFTDVTLTPIDEPFAMGADGPSAYEFVKDIGIVHGLTGELDEPQKAQALENLRAMLAVHETPNGVQLQTAAWVIAATRC